MREMNFENSNENNFLKSILDKLSEEKYGNPLPAIVRKRLDDELSKILAHNFAWEYLQFYEIANELHHMRSPFIVRGTVGNSFVAFLLGLSEVNPLPPHYYCHHCKHTEFVKTDIEGFDLPSVTCPNCGEIMRGDGHALYAEWFMGYDGSEKPSFNELIVTPNGIEVIEQVLRQHTAITPFHFHNSGFSGWYLCPEEELDNINHKKVRHPYHLGEKLLTVDFNSYREKPYIMVTCAWILAMCEQLTSATNVMYTDISLNDTETYQMLWEHLRKEEMEKGSFLQQTLLFPVDKAEAKSYQKLWYKNFLGVPRFSYFVDFFGMMHSNIGNHAKRKGVHRHFCDCDTVLRELILFGFSEKDAFLLANKISFGDFYGKTYGTESIFRYDLPDWYMLCVIDLRPIFARAHDISIIIWIIRLAWFLLNYPQEYMEAQKSELVSTFRQNCLPSLNKLYSLDPL